MRLDSNDFESYALVHAWAQNVSTVLCLANNLLWFRIVIALALFVAENKFREIYFQPHRKWLILFWSDFVFDIYFFFWYQDRHWWPRGEKKSEDQESVITSLIKSFPSSRGLIRRCRSRNCTSENRTFAKFQYTWLHLGTQHSNTIQFAFNLYLPFFLSFFLLLLNL